MRIQLLVSVKDALFSATRLLFRKIFLINPASIYTVFFSLIQFSLNRDSFITPSYIYTILLSSLQLLFTYYSFQNSSFYLCSSPFIYPASIYTVFFFITPPSF